MVLPVQDFLVSLKMLAVERAETTGRPHLADALDLRTLRALGVVLLESFKGRLKETSVDLTVLDRLVLSRVLTWMSTSVVMSEVFGPPRKHQPKPNSVKRKQKADAAALK